MTTSVDRTPSSRQRERDVVRTLRRRLNRFEARYEMRSQDAEAELAAGRLRETAEIAQWMVIWSAYARLRPHRVEEPPMAPHLERVRNETARGQRGSDLESVDFWADRSVRELIDESRVGPVKDPADLHLAGVSDREWEALHAALNLAE